MEVDHPNKRLTSRARAVTRSPHESAGSLLLINLIQIINLIILVVIRIKNALSISFAPGFVIMEFVIEQVVVLGLGDISFFAHGFSNQQKEKRTV